MLSATHPMLSPTYPPGEGVFLRRLWLRLGGGGVKGEDDLRRLGCSVDDPRLEADRLFLIGTGGAAYHNKDKTILL